MQVTGVKGLLLEAKGPIKQYAQSFELASYEYARDKVDGYLLGCMNRVCGIKPPHTGACILRALLPAAMGAGATLLVLNRLFSTNGF
ncbi:hypothetical protein GOBAR_DD07021 [Gossypium barbadense]|nr:hypothetical protein GOBAR_DD07021 [Gossypium barbadense]